MKKWIDIIITGEAAGGLGQVMDKLMVNYDMAQVYTVGAPDEGVNPQAASWAFRNRYPLVLGMPEDIDAMLHRFAQAGNKAVVVFNSSVMDKKRNDTVRMASALPGVQCRRITL